MEDKIYLNLSFLPIISGVHVVVDRSKELSESLYYEMYCGLWLYL